jgi:hypothetical protein
LSISNYSCVATFEASVGAVVTAGAAIIHIFRNKIKGDSLLILFFNALTR